MRKEFVFLAASSTLCGVILFACLGFYYVIKKAFSRLENQLLDIEELCEDDEV